MTKPGTFVFPDESGKVRALLDAKYKVSYRRIHFVFARPLLSPYSFPHHTCLYLCRSTRADPVHHSLLVLLTNARQIFREAIDVQRRWRQTVSDAIDS